MGSDDARDRIVLVVEDDPLIAELVKHVVEDDLGIRVVLADDGERGLELIRELEPALVLLDVNLPGRNGLEVARLVRADPNTQSVVLVAMTSASRTEIFAAGCADHLAKPFDLDDLSALVRRHLGVSQTIGGTDGRRAEPLDPRAITSGLTERAKRARTRALALHAAASDLRERSGLQVARSDRLIGLEGRTSAPVSRSREESGSDGEAPRRE